MASTAAEIPTNNHSGSSRTPRVRVVKGGRYGLSKARQFARTAGTVLVIAIFFGLLASIVASQARITQLSGEIDDAKSELTNSKLASLKPAKSEPATSGRRIGRLADQPGSAVWPPPRPQNLQGHIAYSAIYSPSP